MPERQVSARSTFRACGACGREYTAEELYDLYVAVSYAVNPDAVLVDDPAEIEFCPQCGSDFDS